MVAAAEWAFARASDRLLPVPQTFNLPSGPRIDVLVRAADPALSMSWGANGPTKAAAPAIPATSSPRLIMVLRSNPESASTSIFSFSSTA